MEDPRPPPRELLRTWGESAVPVESGARADARRARIVAGMASTIAQAAASRARSRRRVQVASFACAAIALVGVGVAWRMRAPHGAGSPNPNEAVTAFARVHAVAGSVRATHDGRSAPAAPTGGDIALGADDEVTTGLDGRSEITLADGVAMSLEGASHLHLPAPPPAGADAPLREQVRFDVGVVHVRVPRMPEGHTFSIKTPDAEVTVHGTAFTVEVARNGGNPSTRVRVAEGIVSVASAGEEVRLTAGMQWPPLEESAAESAPELAPTTSAPNLAAAPSSPSRAHHATSDRATSDRVAPGDAALASSLAEQNRLLANAMDASRTGDDKRAIDTLNELLARYPRSPLAQEARVQRFRALERTGNHRSAAREARLYLAAYPNGFAREEARKLALEP